MVKETLTSTEKKKLLTKTIAKNIINPFLTNFPILYPLTNLCSYHFSTSRHETNALRRQLLHSIIMAFQK